MAEQRPNPFGQQSWQAQEELMRAPEIEHYELTYMQPNGTVYGALRFSEQPCRAQATAEAIIARLPKGFEKDFGVSFRRRAQA